MSQLSSSLHFEPSAPTPIYIIHLAHCPQERDTTPLVWHLHYLLDKSHYPQAFNIQIFEGVHGKEDFFKQGITSAHTHPVLNDFDPHLPRIKGWLSLVRLALKSRVNFQSFGQLGCFASHYLLWQECIKLNQPIIVLEDDVLPTSDFYEKCALSLEVIYADKAQVVRLFAIHSKCHPIKTSVSNNFDCLFSPVGGMGTQGYCLSPKGAQKLLNACPPLWILPVDVYMDAFYTHRVQVLTLKSYALLVDPLPSQAPHASAQYFKGKLRIFSWLLRTCNYVLKCKLLVRHFLSIFLKPNN